MPRLLAFSLCLFCSILTQTGCRDPHPGRHNISGTITFNGIPLENGTILFTPKDTVPEAGVTSAQTQIKDGTYSITGGLGLLAGDYKVVIQSQRCIDKKTGEVLLDKPGDPFSYTLENLIPEKYNTNSEIVFTVDEKKGARTFDLDVKTE